MTNLPGKVPALTDIVDYDSTCHQKMVITRLSMALGIRTPIEEKPMTVGEAGRLIRKLKYQLRVKRKAAKRK